MTTEFIRLQDAIHSLPTILLAVAGAYQVANAVLKHSLDLLNRSCKGLCALLRSLQEVRAESAALLFPRKKRMRRPHTPRNH
jgi:hypothetical protein